MKKRPLILFEILIALSLTAILLTFLFSFFVESARMEKKLDTARMAISNRAHLQTRLQSVFSSLSQEGLYTKQFGKEKGTSLVAFFDNGIDPDPAYSGSIIGRLFIDEENNLSFATWPLDADKNRPWRKEILLPHVERLELEFLGKKTADAHGKKEKIRDITANLAWRTHWQEGTPSIIRLTLQEKEGTEPLRFAFILLTADPFVTYTGKKSA